jgi:excisionase family DNA binding protein
MRPYSFIAALDSYKGLMTVEDVAEILDVSKFTVYRMAQRKQLPSLIIGGSRSSTWIHAVDQGCLKATGLGCHRGHIPLQRR